MDIVIMIPATKIKIILKKELVTKFLKIKNAKIAPIGSAKPDKKAFFMAFFLFLVA